MFPTKRYPVCLLLLFAVMLISCSDLLDVEPTSNITSEGFWENPEDAETYLVGIYDQLRDKDPGGNRDPSNTTYYGEDRSDTFKTGDIGPVSEAWAQSLTADNVPDWTWFYNLIYHTNRLLSEIEQIEFNEEAEKNQIKAQAHAIRALVYFRMARIWGQVPVVTEPANNLDAINAGLKSRVPLTEVFAQINSDLNTALELFPGDDYFDKNKITKPAVYALQADVKMWTAKVLNGGEEDLNAALDAIAQVEASGVSLLDDYRSIFEVSNENNDEIIFSLYFEKEEQDAMYGYRLTTRGLNIENAVNKEEIAYTDRNHARAVYAPSEKLVNAFDDDDVRREAAIVAAVTSAQDTILTCFNKFRGSMHEDRYFDNDIIVYRYADIVLLKAEALAALGRIPEAVEELNKTRSRAGLAAYAGPMDQNSVEREILEERWRELFVELKRWPDLVRFHKGGTINIYDEVPNLSDKEGYPLYSPVSQAVLDNNDLIEQTEGY